MQTPVQLISITASVVVIAAALWPLRTASLRDLATAHRDLIERVEVYKTEYAKCVEGNKSACHRAEIQLDEVQRVTKELRVLLTQEMRKK